MLSGFENLRPNVATGQRVSAPLGAVAAVPQPAAIGARADDSGLRQSQAEQREDADDRRDEQAVESTVAIDPTITNGETPPPETVAVPEAAVDEPLPAEALPDTAAEVAAEDAQLPEDAQSPEDGPPSSDDAPIAESAPPPESETAEAEAEAPPPAPRAVAFLEPDSSEMMAAHRAYAASLELAGTRTAAIPAGAVLDGTV